MIHFRVSGHGAILPQTGPVHCNPALLSINEKDLTMFGSSSNISNALIFGHLRKVILNTNTI